MFLLGDIHLLEAPCRAVLGFSIVLLDEALDAGTVS